MEPFNESHFHFLVKEAQQALNKMSAKIMRPEVPTEKRKENLKQYYSLKNFLQEAEKTVDSLIQQLDVIGNEKFRKGLERGKIEGMKENSGGFPNKSFDKEAFRFSWELQVKNKWADHY